MPEIPGNAFSDFHQISNPAWLMFAHICRHITPGTNECPRNLHELAQDLGVHYKTASVHFQELKTALWIVARRGQPIRAIKGFEHFEIREIADLEKDEIHVNKDYEASRINENADFGADEQNEIHENADFDNSAQSEIPKNADLGTGEIHENTDFKNAHIRNIHLHQETPSPKEKKVMEKKKSEGGFSSLDAQPKTRLPESFPLTEKMRAWLAENFTDFPDVEAAHKNFCGEWRKREGDDGMRADWQSTWRRGMRMIYGWQKEDLANGKHPKQNAGKTPNRNSSGSRTDTDSEGRDANFNRWNSFTDKRSV